jgi:hypothetical protein
MRIYLSIILLCITTIAFATDKSLYHPSVISVISANTNNYPKGNSQKIEGPDKSIIIIDPSGIRFLVIGKYTGKERLISNNNKTMIDMYYKITKVDYRQLYINEVEFIDSDQKAYWIPLQTNFYKAFKDEVTEGTVTLYLLWIGAINNNPCILMTEFDAINKI